VVTDPGTAERRRWRTDPQQREHGPKLGDAIARRIEASIVADGWPVGKVLGSEAELIERYGVSRAVFREAVRLVEHHQVARMRRGPGGGLVVTAPHPASVARAMTLNLAFQNAAPGHLIEARTAMEIAAVHLATERIDESGIEALRASVAAERELQDDAQVMGTHDIHLVVAELSGNPALRMFVDVLTRLTNELAVEYASAETLDAVTVAHVHDGIAEAIISGDAALATHRMKAHLTAMGEWLTERSRAGQGQK
jgi:DNA-binding FadR family transcriptional regulator